LAQSPEEQAPMKTDIPKAAWRFAEMGFRLLGCDTDAKIERLNRGESYIKNIPGFYIFLFDIIGGRWLCKEL
jgi:hypothetical protein